MSTWEDDGYVFQYSYQSGDTIIDVYKNEDGDKVEVSRDHSLTRFI